MSSEMSESTRALRVAYLSPEHAYRGTINQWGHDLPVVLSPSFTRPTVTLDLAVGTRIGLGTPVRFRYNDTGRTEHEESLVTDHPDSTSIEVVWYDIPSKRTYRTIEHRDIVALRADNGVWYDIRWTD